VQIIDVATAEVKRPLSVDAGFGGVQSVSFSPKGDMVAAGCANGKIFFVDPTAGEIKSSLNVGGSVSSIDFAPCGNKLAAAFNIHQGISFKEGGVKIFSNLNQGSAGSGFVCQSTSAATLLRFRGVGTYTLFAMEMPKFNFGTKSRR